MGGSFCLAEGDGSQGMLQSAFLHGKSDGKGQKSNEFFGAFWVGKVPFFPSKAGRFSVFEQAFNCPAYLIICTKHANLAECITKLLRIISDNSRAVRSIALLLFQSLQPKK